MSNILHGLVSSIIPVHNRPNLLREAVASVLAQTYRPIEVIISDDGSTDDTPRVGEALERDFPDEVRFLRNPKQGPGPAREAGRHQARGEFIQYLDSDDLLRPCKFDLQVSALRARPECGAAYGYICVHPVDGPPKKTPFKGSGETRPTLFPWLLADRWWNTDAPLFRRTVCDAVGPWSDLRWSQDWEYDGRVAALGTQLVHCPEFVCDERHHKGARQTTPANWLEPERLQSRKRFLEMMFGHAERAGIPAENPHRMHFTRWVFAVARQCAAAGLVREARECMELADRAAGLCREARGGFRFFRTASAVLGWRTMGRLCLRRESSGVKAGRLTLPQSFAKEIE